MNMKMMMALVLAGVSLMGVAMPSQQELDKVGPMVYELMKPEQDALKAGEKTRTQVADAAVVLMGKADGEAAKLLLARGAFIHYVKDGNDDKALETLGLIREEVSDLSPQYAADMLETALKRVPRKNALKLYAILEETKALSRCQGELTKLEAQEKRRPADAALKTKLAEHYAMLGNWPEALAAFEKGDNPRAASTAKAELSGGEDAKSIADFWWDYPEKKGVEQERAFRRHAMSLYEQALASGKVCGLEEVQLSRRIKEVKSLGEPMFAVPTMADGLYCVINLSAGPNASRYPVSYLKDIPKGGWTDEYKTTKLVLRKIEPGSFEYLPGKKFTITKPFHIGIFEVTQKQYELVCGNNPSGHKGDRRPVDHVSYAIARGGNKGLTWPQTDEVDADSFVGRIRQRSGLHLDLPTEVQWEYACRAGGTICKGERQEDVLKVANCAENGGRSRHSTVVGSLEPNKWGLYDMRGNVWEWCLDRGRDLPWYLCKWNHDPKEKEVDPVGISKGSKRALSGGSWDDPWTGCPSRDGHLVRFSPTGHNDHHGFRLVLQPPFVPPTQP